MPLNSAPQRWRYRGYGKCWATETSISEQQKEINRAQTKADIQYVMFACVHLRTCASSGTRLIGTMPEGVPNHFEGQKKHPFFFKHALKPVLEKGFLKVFPKRKVATKLLQTMRDRNVLKSSPWTLYASFLGFPFYIFASVENCWDFRNCALSTQEGDLMPTEQLLV